MVNLYPSLGDLSSYFHFEASGHTYLQSEFNDQAKQLAEGHLDTHFWHSEGLRERITSYGFNAPALVLGIDSLEPLVFYNDKGMEWRTLAWYELPARPRELNHTGKVRVVRFDILGDHMEQYAMWTGKPQRVPNTILNQEANLVGQEFQDTTLAYDNSIFTEDATITAFAATLAALLSSRKGMSRRDFLKTGIRLTAAGAVGSWLLDQGRYALRKQTDDASNEAAEQLLLTVNKVL